MKYFRHPKTQQELRQFYADDADYQHEEDFPSPRRKRRHIRTLWDDIWANTQRSWKRHREAQWKPKKTKTKKKKSKFRGHLSTRTVDRRGKKHWHYSPEIGRYYTYKRVQYHEGVGDKQVEYYARIINQPWKVVVWNCKIKEWQCKWG